MVSTFLYGNASQKFATKVWNWNTLRVSGLLIDHNYVPRINHDVYVSDVYAAAIIARSNALGAYMTGQVAVNGICSGVLPQFDAIAWPSPAVALVLYVDTGNDATSELIYYSSDGAGFPLALTGFNYYIAENMAYGGWFQV